MALIFTNFPTGRGSQPCALLKSVDIQSHPQVFWENSNIVLLSLIEDIILRYYFGVNCIGYLDMLQNIFLLHEKNFLIDSNVKISSRNY